MAWSRQVPFSGGVAQLRFTGRAEGDLAVRLGDEPLAERRADVVDLPWVWVRQVHGAAVITVPGGPGAPTAVEPSELAGSEADALVTDRDALALAVHTADCAPVLLVSPEGIVAAVHAGWRGLEEGVLQRSVEEMARLGASTPSAVLGPCIGPECYEFGPDELKRITSRYGSAVAGRTSQGRPALDVAGAVDAALAEAGVAPAERIGPCTACARDELFSHRAGAERERQAAVVWLEYA